MKAVSNVLLQDKSNLTLMLKSKPNSPYIIDSRPFEDSTPLSRAVTPIICLLRASESSMLAAIATSYFPPSRGQSVIRVCKSAKFLNKLSIKLQIQKSKCNSNQHFIYHTGIHITSIYLSPSITSPSSPSRSRTSPSHQAHPSNPSRQKTRKNKDSQTDIAQTMKNEEKILIHKSIGYRLLYVCNAYRPHSLLAHFKPLPVHS